MFTKDSGSVRMVRLFGRACPFTVTASWAWSSFGGGGNGWRPGGSAATVRAGQATSQHGRYKYAELNEGTDTERWTGKRGPLDRVPVPVAGPGPFQPFGARTRRDEDEDERGRGTRGHGTGVTHRHDIDLPGPDRAGA
jgi:hypothetical protein